MRKYIVLFLLLGCTLSLVAQKKYDHPCGTPPVKSDWLKSYQANPQAFTKGNDTLIYLPLKIHSVGTNTGTGHVSIINIMEGLCQLNEDFGSTNIQFFISGDINFIDSTKYYNHDTLYTGYQMMIYNNVPNHINCYIVGNPAGNAGYNLPSANAIALMRGTVNYGNHTWAHEIGHNLSVQHPFLGWEGKQYSYSTPTPTTVTYDYTSFKPTWYNSNDTTIIDTTQVELTDGSNCTVAADGFCDTSPDYLAFGSGCNANGESSILQKDPNGVDFRSDATLIMGYFFDACQSKFTPEQSAAMRANVYATKPGYLFNQNPMADTIPNQTVLVEPIQGADVQFDNVELKWNPTPNATQYVVQASIFSTFALIAEEVITTDTSVLLTSLQNNRTYYWRVKPFNQGYGCTPLTANETFSTKNLVSTQSVPLFDELSIYPTLLTNQSNITILAETSSYLDVEIRLFDTGGKLLFSQNSDMQSGSNRIEVPSNVLPNNGLYYLHLKTKNGVHYQKVMVMR